MDESLVMRFSLHSKLRQYRHHVGKAQERVSEWVNLVDNPYVAFSTGKDSTCLLHLVREQAPDIPAVYFDAECSYPETLEILDATENCIIYAADEPLLDTFERYGGIEGGPELERETMRTTVYGPIKRLIAEYDFDGVAYGLRAEESWGRRMNAYVRGGIFRYKRDGLWGCQPIWDWEYDDVWAYIVTHDLDYCPVYDKMWNMPEEDQRLSYWAGSTKRRWGRWAWLKRNYPELWNRLAKRFPEVRAYV